ncbi:MAG: hypothetical protein JWQ89_1470 [Devosia sp.]|uniref:hypothetical protein n=1 Tax=Devosia sp. TaxID=1871048 RepID=UPI0026058E7B|nr:hypothetical protein [Devosia sp.]MDB5539743.1 hypothetical protein [Devosia sp.]
MSLTSRRFALIAGLALASIGPALAAGMTDAEVISNATSAAPAAVGKNATVVTFDDQMQMKTLQQGSNGFTCMPDNPASPTNDPICVDAGGMAWLTAYNEKKDPPAGQVGFGYMLQGESAADNVDPYATEPPAGQEWMVDGPHVMIFNVADMLGGYPQGEHPDHTQPYVMWPNTPYAHLMMPVQ